MLFVEKDITKIEVSQWADFIKNHPKGSVFQTPEIYNCYKNTPNHTPIILVAMSDSNIVGVLLAVIISEGGNLKKYFTSRSIIIGGPIVKNDNNEIISFLLKEYNLYIKGKAIYTQIRNHYEQLLNNDAFQENNYRFKSHLNFRIKLDAPDNIWNRIGKGRIKQIKKAIKNQLSVEVYENDICEDLIIKGYDIIKSVYKRAGLPLVGIDLIKEVCNKKLLVLFVVKDSTSNIIGCRFGIKYKDEIYGWYAGSYSEYYKLFPNDILIWETLKWSCEHGYKVFDYGGAGEPNKPYGVRAFKSQMGGELVNYGRYELVHKKILYKIGQLGMAILKSRKIGGGEKFLITSLLVRLNGRRLFLIMLKEIFFKHQRCMSYMQIHHIINRMF